MLHKYILEWGKKILFVVHWGLNSKSIDKAWLVLFTGVVVAAKFNILRFQNYRSYSVSLATLSFQISVQCAECGVCYRKEKSIWVTTSLHKMPPKGPPPAAEPEWVWLTFGDTVRKLPKLSHNMRGGNRILKSGKNKRVRKLIYRNSFAHSFLWCIK